MLANFFSLTVSEFFLRGSKFLLFVCLANLYSQDVVYEYGYFTALFSIVFVFSDLGYQTLITKAFAQSNSYKNYVKYASLSIFRVLLFIIISSLFIAYFLFTNSTLFVFIGILFLADAIFAMNFAFYRALHKSTKESISKFIIGIIFCFASLLAFLNFDIQILFSVFSLTYLFYSFYSSKFLRLKYLKLFILNFRLSEYLSHSKSSFYIFVAALCTIGYLRVDILMLDWLDDAYSVSIYTIASRVLELSLVIPSVISILLLPKFVQNKNTNISKNIFLQFFIGIVTMLFFLFVSTIIVEQLFKDYIVSDEILKILLLSVPFILINSYIFTFFISKNKSEIYMYITLFMLICNIILNYVYIPMFGYKAAAYTTILTEVVGSFIALVLLYLYNKNNKTILDTVK